MSAFETVVQQGSLHAWLYIPAAIVLGALHGLEPGHSKTMMAAFIIAVRGTIMQAVLLGLCAAFSHSLVIWILAVVALHYGGQINAGTVEPYFQIGSSVVIFLLAAWMTWRTRMDIRAESQHGHDHDHGDHHHDDHDHDHHHDHKHQHDEAHQRLKEFEEYQDAHEKAHAEEIEKRFAGRSVTTGQIMLFGLTGGLIPCPAAFTIVLVCLQLKQFALGIVMVAAFSFGLALTLVGTGILAAWSLRHAEKRFGGLGKIARQLPYLSSGILAVLAIYMGVQGWLHLGTPGE